MKLAIYAFLLTSIIVYNSYSQQNGWVWINRYPQGNNLITSSISGSNTAFIVGDYGALLKTTNNGLNWNNNFTLPFKNFTYILFINSITGFASGAYGNSNIYKTTDAGNNWFLLNTGLTDYVNHIFFYDQNTGVAAGNFGKMIKTTDGGNSWINIPPVVNMTFYEFAGFNNSNACYVRTNNDILKSYNLGESWLILPTPDSTIGIRDMVFLNENTGMYLANFGWISNSLKFVKTTDGGNSWFNYSLGTNNDIRCMYFLNENTGFAAGGYYNTRGTIMKTTNGGINWVTQADSLKYFLNDIRCFDQNNGFASGLYGTLLTTTNGGLNWNYYSRGFIEHVTNIFFNNELTGYISIIYNSRVLKTTNGGNSWDTVFIAPAYVNSIKFVNNNTGYIGGGINFNQGFIYKTTNSGLNWTSQTYFPFQPVREIHFLNDLTGYAAGQADNVLKTTNGGTNWEVLTAGGSSYIYSVFFVNINTGFLSGYGRIYKTTNAGLSWNQTTLGNSILSCVMFVNEQTGFLTSTYSPYLYKTSDQGVSWNPISLSFLTSSGKIFFTDVNSGYILGGNKLYKTTDCGVTWLYQDAFTNLNGDIFFINSATGYIGGDNGTFLKTTNGGGNFVGINLIRSDIPKTFSLSQNYPNPFNPITHLRFEIPDFRFVRLIIYDLLGREVTTLVNGKLTAGKYDVSWDASNYPSGVYFYSLLTDDYTESKKMILLR